MHLHILGICGTFMAGVAALARAAGHRVTGADRGVYPPMSEQLAAQCIEIIDGFDPAQLDLRPDLIVVGNVMSRGMPIVEAMLNRRLDFVSGPEWLAREILPDQRVVAVAGTHGKTTTASLLAFILERAGLGPGFLIGGMPVDFPESARPGNGSVFVIEADEYDTAFFDKRAKLLHYRPEIQVINNLEFDHADIYADLAAIQWQFHQCLRMLPGNGRLIVAGDDPNIRAVVEQGCWTPVETFSSRRESAADWIGAADATGRFELIAGGERQGGVSWRLAGSHNAENATAAILAARALGVTLEQALAAVGEFRGVRRRLELRGTFGGVEVYDDFAHHPTAIRRTIDGLGRSGGRGRLLIVLEPRSNTMKLGVHQESLADALRCADRCWIFRPNGIDWNLERAVGSLPQATVADEVAAIVEAVASEAAPGDRVVVMSNGGFENIHARLERALAAVQR